VDDPDAAVPHPEAPALLRDLDAQYPLWIVTGRDLQALSSFLDRPFAAIGLHGAQEGIVGKEPHNLMSEAAATALADRRQSVPSIDGLRVEEKDQSFAVHYRDVADEEAARARIDRWLDDLPEALDAIWGKKVVELRPEGLTKGTAVRRIASEHPDHVPVYLGDDVTDEDAFAALQEMDREAVTIKVGDDDTRAAARLDGPDAVMEYLRQYV
jgi:trehalose 6-phosphate phosphatase